LYTLGYDYVIISSLNGEHLMHGVTMKFSLNGMCMFEMNVQYFTETVNEFPRISGL